MTSLADSAVCARCHQHKPAEEFSRNAAKRNGLDSYCKDCAGEYARQYQDFNSRGPTSPHSTQISQSLEHGDALKYSRAVCDHIAWYTQRKITEFESTHHMEAPPHMTAILAIAKSISAQHPIRKAKQPNQPLTYDLVCRKCGESFTARAPNVNHCDACKPSVREERNRARQEQKKAWLRTPAGQAYRALEQKRENERRQAERAARLPLIIQCQRCGASVKAKTRHRKYCKDCAYHVRVEKAEAWRKSERGKELRRAWNHTERGQEARRREHLARKERRAQTPPFSFKATRG